MSQNESGEEHIDVILEGELLDKLVKKLIEKRPEEWEVSGWAQSTYLLGTLDYYKERNNPRHLFYKTKVNDNLIAKINEKWDDSPAFFDRECELEVTEENGKLVYVFSGYERPIINDLFRLIIPKIFDYHVNRVWKKRKEELKKEEIQLKEEKDTLLQRLRCFLELKN